MSSMRDGLISFLVGSAWLMLLSGCDSPDDRSPWDGHCYEGHEHERWANVAGASGVDGAGSIAGNSSLSAASRRRHVIIMVGDGMATASEVAASRYLHGSDFGLSFQALPFMAHKTTWDVDVYDIRANELGLPHYSPGAIDPKVGYDPDLGGASPYPLTADSDSRRAYFSSSGWVHPDSAATATAMSTGVKTRSASIAWRPDAGEDGALETSAELLRRLYGMSIGFVTTTPFSHATPAGFFSHSTSRGFTAEIANEILNVVRPDVAIGGGWQDTGYYDPVDLERAIASNDWIFTHLEDGVDSNDAILSASVRANQEHKRLLGLYGGGSGWDNFIAPSPVNDPGAPHVDVSSLDRPTLPTSSVAALEVLSRDPDGFFLMIEQGHVDWSNHAQDFAKMVGCVWELDQAVQAVTAFIDRPDDEIDWSNTTLIVTADHSNGYMRFDGTMGPGELPREDIDTDYSPAEFSYPDGEITFNSEHVHTSELVDVYAKGFAAARLRAYQHVYPELKIIDDTAIYSLTLDAARR